MQCHIIALSCKIVFLILFFKPLACFKKQDIQSLMFIHENVYRLDFSLLTLAESGNGRILYFSVGVLYMTVHVHVHIHVRT